MDKQPTPRDTKKETQKYYNCGIKEYLARDYRKSKTGTKPQKK